jgi:hypothetical protein
VFWTLTWAEEGPGRPTKHFQLTISGRPLRFDLHHSVLPESAVVGGSPRIYAGEKDRLLIVRFSAGDRKIPGLTWTLERSVPSLNHPNKPATAGRSLGWLRDSDLFPTYTQHSACGCELG